MEDQTQVTQEGFQTLEKPQQLTLIDLEAYTGKAIDSIERIKEQLKQNRQMLSDGYINNATYKEQADIVKDARKKLLSIKSQIDKVEGVVQLKQKVKDLRFELNESKRTLTSFALEYTSAAGIDQIEKNGQTYTIVKSVKLVRGKQ